MCVCVYTHTQINIQRVRGEMVTFERLLEPLEPKIRFLNPQSLNRTTDRMTSHNPSRLTHLTPVALLVLLLVTSSSSLRLRASATTTTFTSNALLRVQSSKKKLNQHAFTFMDSSGAFPGMGHCVEGVLQAHLQARESNIRIAELPSFMNEYCEEDVAAALGRIVPKSANKMSIDSVWDAATSNSSGAAQGQGNLMVTRRNDVVRTQVDSNKRTMITTMCSRMADLYEPKCCKEHRPCCSGVWRARFANRPDALRYCHLVREAVEGRFSNALRQANEEVKLLEDRTQLPSYHAQSINTMNPDCAPGGKKEHTLECGQLGDGSMLATDGGRSLPSYNLEAARIHSLREAQDTIRLVQKEVEESKSRLKDVRSVLSRTTRPSGIAMDLVFTSKQPLDSSDFAGSEDGATAITFELLENVVATSLYNVNEKVVTVNPEVHRLCSRENPCTYGLTDYKDNTTAFIEEDNDQASTSIDHVVHVVIKLSSVKKAKRVEKILATQLYLSTLQASFGKVMKSYNVTHTFVKNVKRTLGAPQSPPQWYVDQISTKVMANEKETKVMLECEEYSKKLLVLIHKKSDHEINVAVLKESGKPSSQEQNQVERLTLEIHIIGLNLTYCRDRGRLMYLSNGASGENGQGEITTAITPDMIELQRRMKNTNIEIKTVVQQGRLRASLGALSLKARRIASQVEVATSVVKRARLEAQLAEFNMMRSQINAQLDRDTVHTKRLDSIRSALVKDPKNIQLQKRLKKILMEDTKEREMLIGIAKAGDACAPCRTRVLSVMENAVQHGFEEKHLPDYMESFCEVRLAITGSSHALRDMHDINNICSTFRSNLDKDLKESTALQLKDERLDSLSLQRSEKSPSHMNDGSRKPIRFRTTTAEGHNATLHAYCRATSECGGMPSSPPSSADARSSTAVATTTTTHHFNHGRPPITECDRCASNLMGEVNAWRTTTKETEETNAIVLHHTYTSKLQHWCHTRLSLTWTVRKDLIDAACTDAAIVPLEEDAVVVASSDNYLFNPKTWNVLSKDSQAHRDLVQLYHVCTAIGECATTTTTISSSSSSTEKKPKTPSTSDTSSATTIPIPISILPTEEEQDKMNRLVEEADYLKNEKAKAKETLKKASDMEYAAKDQESKTEEVAAAQREAADACAGQLKVLQNEHAENEEQVDHFCIVASKSETKMERVSRQLNLHSEQYKTLVSSFINAEKECETLRKLKFVEYQTVKKQERKVLMKCVLNVNQQIHKYKGLEKEFNTNVNYPAGSDVQHPTIQMISKKLDELNKALKVCEENEVMNVAKGDEEREQSDTECKSKLGAMKQAQASVKALEMMTTEKHVKSITDYDLATTKCKKQQKEQKQRVAAITSMTLKCAAADKLALTTQKRSAAAAAAAAAVEVSKAVAQAEEESLDGNDRGATGATDGATDGATGGGMEEESSNAADTYGGCALDVMAHARNVKKTTSKASTKISLWPMVSAWALRFCKAEAESAKSRALLIGKPFLVDIDAACNFASNIFMSARASTELDIALKFCKTIRQFTGKPQNGIVYDRTAFNLLPKAPLSLRPESNLSPFLYGPGPIAKTSEKSDMEWYATTEEATRLRHNKYGSGNMDRLMAPQDADVSARVGQPDEMVVIMEQKWKKIWKNKETKKGVVFEHDLEDVVLEPNRQLKVPIPKHRYVGSGSETGGETGGEAGETGGSR